MRVLVLMAASLVGAFVGCRPTPKRGDAVANGDARCASRTGGAEITMKVNDQTFRFCSTNAAFIVRALQLRDSKKQATIMFKILIDGTDCDAQWTFHVDPNQMDCGA